MKETETTMEEGRCAECRWWQPVEGDGFVCLTESERHMNELIEKLKAATGPDRALDWQIHLRDGLLGVGMYGDHPPYTASLDAALTLVPDEPLSELTGKYDWQVECTNGGVTISARVGPEATLSFANTAALALCIAALKARL